MRKILLLRHGMTESNERRIFSGATDVPLSERGVRELEARRGTYPQADVYFTSGMLRARQTLSILYGDVPHKDIPDFREFCLGDFEGRSHDDLYANEPVYRRWLEPDGDDIACPGGETRRDFDVRVWRGWQQLLAEDWDGLAVLVAHGGMFSTLMDRLCGEKERFAPPKNGDGWMLEVDDAGEVACWQPWPEVQG